MQDDPTQPVSSDDLVRAARASVGSSESLSEQMLREAQERIGADFGAGSTPGPMDPIPEMTDSAPSAEPKVATRPAPPPPSSAPSTSRPKPAGRRPAPPPRRSPGPLEPSTRSKVPKAARGLIPLIVLGVFILSNFFGGNDDSPDAVPVTVTVTTQVPPTAVQVSSDAPSVNLAWVHPTAVSGQTADGPGRNAVDGDPETAWNAGGFPPQWIDIDLGAPATIREVRLRVGQSPVLGDTRHFVLVRGPGTDGEEYLFHEFEGKTANNIWITARPEDPLSGIDHVRVVTGESQSRVAWFEIEVLGVHE